MGLNSTFVSYQLLPNFPALLSDALPQAMRKLRFPSDKVIFPSSPITFALLPEIAAISVLSSTGFSFFGGIAADSRQNDARVFCVSVHLV